MLQGLNYETGEKKYEKKKNLFVFVDFLLLFRHTGNC